MDTFDGPLEGAYPPLSVALRLGQELDVSRGDMICAPSDLPEATQEFEATLCWLNETPLRLGGHYLLRHTTRTVRARVETLQYRLDVNTMERDSAAPTLGLNEIGQVTVKTSKPLFVDPYARNRTTGSFILIDAANDATVAGGLIR